MIREYIITPMGWLRGIRASLTAVAGVVITLAQLNLPTKAFWENLTVLQWISVGVAGCFVIYEGVAEINYLAKAKGVRTYDGDLRLVLSGTVGDIVRTTGTPWDEVTIRYYRQRRWLHYRVGGWIRVWRLRHSKKTVKAARLRRARLHQIDAVRAGADAGDAHRAVHPGVGLCGVAFAVQALITEDWGEFYAKAQTAGKQAWEQLDATQRWGLSWVQLLSSYSPHRVLATPTFKHGDDHPTGAVVLEGSIGLPELNTVEMTRIMNELVTQLDRLGAPPKGWWRAHAR